MSKINKNYRGHGEPEIMAHIKANGALNGKMVRVNGEYVCDVNFDISNNQLQLTVNGREFTSINDALQTNLREMATCTANGSSDNGNAANNIIGNYNSFNHIVFGKTTLAEIVGHTTAERKPRQVAQVKRKAPQLDATTVNVRLNIDTTPAAGNLYRVFKREQIKPIAISLGGAEAFQEAIANLTIAEFAQQFNVPVAV